MALTAESVRYMSFQFRHCSCEVIDDVAVQRMACDVQNVIKIVGATSSESVLVETVPSRHHELLFLKAQVAKRKDGVLNTSAESDLQLAEL